MISSLLVTSDDLSGQCQVDGEPELWVSAGKSYAVPIMIDRPGVTLTWEFSTQPKVRSWSWWQCPQSVRHSLI